MHNYSQTRSDLIYCRTQDLQPRVMFAVCLYNYPRSIRRIGQLEHLVDGNVIAEAFVAVTPVFVSDFPLFIRIVHARVEALQLLRVVYVKPEFHHNSARISEGSLKFVYFIICAGPFALFCEAFKALNHHAAIPASVVYSYMPCFWQCLPEQKWSDSL